MKSTYGLPDDLAIGYIPPRFVAALVAVAKSLRNSGADWSIGGELADNIRNARLVPDCAELLTTKDGAAKMHDALTKYNPTDLKLVEQRLPKDANIKGNSLPVSIRSYFFEFMVGDAKFKVHGDLQFRVGDWEWGDVLEFKPELLSVVGEKMMLVPAIFNIELYKSLGWTDRENLIVEALTRAHSNSCSI